MRKAPIDPKKKVIPHKNFLLSVAAGLFLLSAYVQLFALPKAMHAYSQDQRLLRQAAPAMLQPQQQVDSNYDLSRMQHQLNALEQQIQKISASEERLLQKFQKEAHATETHLVDLHHKVDDITDLAEKLMDKRHANEDNAVSSLSQEETLTVTTDSTPEKCWEHSQTMPQWMKEYMEWHQQALHNMTTGINHWKDYDYYVVRCLARDTEGCGGTADRLTTLPYFLLLSHRAQRLLFFHWERPAPLQEFLVPPRGGMNWTWPPHPDLANHEWKWADAKNMNTLHRILGYHDAKESEQDRQKKPKKMPKVASILVQSYFHGSIEYDAMRENNETESDYVRVFHDAWNCVFVPSPPVQNLIDQRMQELNLQKDQYHAVHIRAAYNDAPVNLDNQASNAVNCLAKYVTSTRHEYAFNSSTPIYVASDTIKSTQSAVAYARKNGLPQTTSLLHNTPNGEPKNEEEPILHLDRGLHSLARKSENWTTHEPHEYYNTFVDLYMLSLSKCIVFNYGNYGKFANMLSSDYTCQYNHRKDGSCQMPEFLKPTTSEKAAAVEEK